MITRSKNRNLFGVCGGIAEYFNLNPTIVRILFVLAAILTGSIFVWIYFLLSLILPNAE